MNHDNPLLVWKNVPYGNAEPSAYFTERLNTTNGLRQPHQEIMDIVSRKYPFKWGMDYWSTNLDSDGSISITISNNLGFNKDLTRVEGLEAEPGNPNMFHHWQRGLTRIVDYYIYSPTCGLQSVRDVMQRLTQREVEIYFFDPQEGKDVSPKAIKLNRRNGQEYFAVFVHNPCSRADVLHLLHEFGHVVAMVKTQQLYDNLAAELGADDDWISAAKEYDATMASWGNREPTPSELQKLYTRFYSSVGFAKRQDLGMIIEVDAWVETLELIKLFGLECALKFDSEELINYMWWAIKTRIPTEQLDNNTTP